MDTAPPDFQIVAYGPTLFYLGGELDLSSAARFHDEIQDSVRAGGLITLDVSALRFIDGAGIRVLNQALDESKTGCIVVHGTSWMFRRLADAVGISGRPRLHLLGCDEDPFPRKTVRSIPMQDIAARFQALRNSYLTMNGDVRSTNEQARALVERAVATRSLLAERRAA